MRHDEMLMWFHRPICDLYQVVESEKTVYVLSIKWVGR
jgi:hypothetical protein